MDYFFRRPETADALKALAQAEDMVLFVGAGVPASQGLPTWNQLLDQLLLNAAARDGRLPQDQARREYVDALLKSYDSAYLGSLVRSANPDADALRDLLRHELYDRRKLYTDEVSANFVRSVWQLVLTRRMLKRDTLLLTTNYDDVLEVALGSDSGLRALLEKSGDPEVQSLTGPPPADADGQAIRIFHLHGFIPRAGTSDGDASDPQKIVLSAADYGTNWAQHWSYTLLEKYWSCPWLFVGMSFTDTHISFYSAERHQKVKQLRRVAPSVGVFSLQARDWKHIDAALKPSLVDAEIARLRELGMQALPTDYFFQDAQFLRELCLRLQGFTKKGQSYPGRLGTWQTMMLAHRFGPKQIDRQREFGQHVSQQLVEIRTALEKLKAQDTNEQFKVELWCRDIDSRGLLHVGSSEFVYHDPSRSRRFPLTTESHAAAAVAAFTKGSPECMSAPTVQEHGRWESFFAAAVTLDAAPWHGLPVGALVLASTEPMKDQRTTLLAHEQSVRRRLADWLAMCADALDPTITIHDLVDKDGGGTLKAIGKTIKSIVKGGE